MSKTEGTKVKELISALGEQRALQIVKQRYDASRKASMQDFEKFARFYRLYRNQQTQKSYNGLSNLFVPEPYRIVRRKTAKLSNAIKRVLVTPEGETSPEVAQSATRTLNYIRRKRDWHLIERAGIRESRIVGLAWWKLLWNLDKEEEDKPYLGFDLTFEKADKVFIEDGKTILDIFAGNIRWIIHEYEAEIETLKKNKNYNQTALQILALRAGNTRSEPTPLDQARSIFQSQQQQTSDKQTKKFIIWEYHGKYKPSDNEEEEDRIIVVADKTIVLRNSDHPYKLILKNPLEIFTPVVADIDGSELYPIGDLEPGESLFNELNDTRNQRMDTVTLNIDPPKIRIKAAQIRDEDLIPRRGWIIDSNLPDGIQFIHPSMEGVVAAANEEKNIRGDIQQYSGVIDFAPGTEVQAGINIDTARGVIVAKGESDVIIEDEIQILKICLRRLYRVVLAFAQNFLDRPFEIVATEKGSEIKESIDKTKITGKMDLDIEMQTLQDKTTQQQLVLLMLNIAKSIPGSKIGKFWVDVLEVFHDTIKIEEYYEEPQPIPEKPNISISLRGDLSESEVDEIYKLTGADPKAADPVLREGLRELMRGNLPENIKRQEKEIDITQKRIDVTRAATGALGHQELSEE